MAEIVMIMGESGSGKTASLRNFKAGEVCVLNVAGKRLPFRNDFGKNVVNTSSYPKILSAVRSGKFKTYVVDDAQYLMAFENFDNAKIPGYNKFTDMALNYYNMLRGCQEATVYEKQPDGTYIDTGRRTDDTIVYFLQHVDNDDGFIKPKTLGKMLDQQLNVAGMFTTVLLARTDGKDYWFETHSDGTSVVKSPMGMFTDNRIENDLKMVDETIRAYYGMEG